MKRFLKGKMESTSLLGVVIFACLPLAQAGGDVDSHQSLSASARCAEGERSAQARCDAQVREAIPSIGAGEFTRKMLYRDLMMTKSRLWKSGIKPPSHRCYFEQLQCKSCYLSEPDSLICNCRISSFCKLRFRYPTVVLWSG